MNTGTQAAREAGQYGRSRLQSDQTDRGGRNRQATLDDARRAHTFSSPTTWRNISPYPRDVPGVLSAARRLNVMHLASPQSAILSAIIFNALIIIALIPLAWKVWRIAPIGPGRCCQRNLMIYGLGGIIIPFIASRPSTSSLRLCIWLNTVIASEAKQSTSTKIDWMLRRFAPRNDGILRRKVMLREIRPAIVVLSCCPDHGPRLSPRHDRDAVRDLPKQAQGSLTRRTASGRLCPDRAGFKDDKYFHGRPSRPRAGSHRFHQDGSRRPIMRPILAAPTSARPARPE